MFLRQIPDPNLAQYSYLIGCQRSGEAIVIDPERDIERYQEIASQEGLKITAIAETHIHAKPLSLRSPICEIQKISPTHDCCHASPK
jgi:hydroxyacylglutathione hydrolase